MHSIEFWARKRALAELKGGIPDWSCLKLAGLYSTEIDDA